MENVIDLVLTLIVGIVNVLEDSPFMPVFGLCIVAAIYIMMVKIWKGGKA